MRSGIGRTACRSRPQLPTAAEHLHHHDEPAALRAPSSCAAPATIDGHQPPGVRQPDGPLHSSGASGHEDRHIGLVKAEQVPSQGIDIASILAVSDNVRRHNGLTSDLEADHVFSIATQLYRDALSPRLPTDSRPASHAQPTPIDAD